MKRWPSTYRMPAPYVVLTCGHAVPRGTAGITAHQCPGPR